MRPVNQEKYHENNSEKACVADVPQDKRAESNIDGACKGISICILGASFGTNNLGVSALANSAVKIVLNAFPSADVFLFDYERQPGTSRVRIGNNAVDIPLINIRFSKKVLLPNNIAFLMALALLWRLSPFGFIRRAVMRNKYLCRIHDANVVLSLAGGDSFSDIYGLPRLFYVSLPQILALVLRKKLVLLPQTLGPFRGGIARNVARWILRRAHRVYVRDYASKDEMKRIGGADLSGRCEFCHDCAFVLDAELPSKIDIRGQWDRSKRPRVGVNISGLLYIGGYNRRNMFGLRIDYPQLVETIVETIINQFGADVILIPHTFGLSEESDESVCERVFETLRKHYPDRIALAAGKYDQNEIKYIIGTCDFFIGSRMHACIAAVSQSIPTVPIAYSRKFLGVWESIGLRSLVVDPTRMDADSILCEIHNAWNNRERTRQQLVERVPFIQSTVMRLLAGAET